MRLFSVILIGTMLTLPLVGLSNELTQDGRYAKDLIRDKQSKGPEIIAMANIQQGMNVLDVFGGGGYYSELLSKVVGLQGKVTLHNNKAYMPFVGMELEARLANNRLKNVFRIDKEAENLALAKNSFDAIFFILGYHDLYVKTKDWNVDKRIFLAQLQHALKPNGQLIIVDHSALAGTGTDYSQQTHRIEKQYVINELNALGFSLSRSSDILSNKDDDRVISPFDPKIRRKTDRFVMIFTK